MKKILLMAIVPSIMLCFLFSSTATASPIELTIGWHNLAPGDYFLIDEFGSDINGSKIKTKLLHGSKLVEAQKLDGTGLIDLGTFGFEGDVDVWGLKTKKKFNKKAKKITKKAKKSAAKSQLKDLNGNKKGWEKLYGDWKRADTWSLYNENDFFKTAFDNKFDGTTFKGKIGDQKFRAHVRALPNPEKAERIDLPSNPVPEPATMLLFGLGLLGLARVSRKKQ